MEDNNIRNSQRKFVSPMNTDEIVQKLKEPSKTAQDPTLSYLTIDKAKEMYYNDIEFHNLVQHMIRAIIDLQLTPAEIRCAATFACIMIEMSGKVD